MHAVDTNVGPMPKPAASVGDPPKLGNGSLTIADHKNPDSGGSYHAMGNIMDSMGSYNAHSLSHSSLVWLVCP